MKEISARNGKKGGRPHSYEYMTAIFIPEIDFVVLTEKQYNTLIERYGVTLIKKAISILDEWLQTSPIGYKYKGKNNYALFRVDGWLINLAKNLI